MSAPSEIVWGVESYRSVVFPLKADGTMPWTNDAAPYEGLQFTGSRVFDVTPAQARAVENYGDGRLRDTIYLPPNTSHKGVLRVGYDNHAINAALTNVNVVTDGEMKWTPMATEQQGNEPIVALLLMQMGRDEAKLKRWRSYWIPRAQCLPMPSSYNESGTEVQYQITMSPSLKTLWNETLTLIKHGCIEYALGDAVTEGRPNIVFFEGDGVYDVLFTLPADKPALSTAKMKVWDYTAGTEITAGITKATTSVTFDAVPTTPFSVVYEY